MTNIPKTFKAALLVEYNKPMKIGELPMPEVEDCGILVKVEMAGICGTDVHEQRGELTIGNALPIVPGHETIGKIVKLGQGRTKDISGEPLKVGDRIMWIHVDCGECYYCGIPRQGILCAKRRSYGFALNGGFAEYAYLIPPTNVVRVPDELSDEEVIGAGCAFRSVVCAFERLGEIGISENVVIQGAGPIGLYSLLLAVESAAGKTIVVGAPKIRLDLALKWGANHVINIDEVKDPAKRNEQILSLTNGRGPELVVEGSGVPIAFNEGLNMIQKGGRYLIVGQTSHATIPMAPGMIVGKNLRVIGSGSADITHVYKAVQFVKNKQKKYPFADLVSHKYKLEEINDAMDNMAKGLEIKPVIDNRGR